MEAELQDSLGDLGYPNGLMEEGELEKAVREGLTSKSYIGLVIWLGEQLDRVCKLEEKVHPVREDADLEGFQIELRSFLREIGCPHGTLTGDDEGKYLEEEKTRWRLIDFLVSELASARILAICQPGAPVKRQKSGVDLSPAEESFQRVLKCVDLSQPSLSVPTATIFKTLETKIKKLQDEVPPQHLSSPLIVSPLQPHQLEKLGEMNKQMEEEYCVRRRMLLKRADVTVQSLKWSNRTKDKEGALQEVYEKQRLPLRERCRVSLAQVMGARKDLMNVVKTSNDAVRSRTKTPINKVLIGRVPDRGGRPNESRPPPEMPSFRNRTEAPKEKREPGGGSRRGRGRVQGGWADSGGGKSGGDWSRQDSGGGGRQQYNDNFSRQDSGGYHNEYDSGRGRGHKKGGWGRGRGGAGGGGYTGQAGGGGRRTVYQS